MPRTAAPATPLPGGRAPLYSRLRQAIRERVLSGEWRPGDQIPTIRQLGDLYGVSRITVVQALDALAREGMLVRWQGKGVFVGQPRTDEPHASLLSFSEEALRHGQTPGSRTLRLRREPATPGLQTRLSLRPEQYVVLIERLRLLDEQPAAIQQAYLPEHLVPDLVRSLLPIDSLYRLLADTYGLLPTNASESYEPIVLSAEHARILDSRQGAPAMQVDRTTIDQYGRTIEYVTSVVRGDRTYLHLALSREQVN
jgi:GntR family transcriptional regulator